jgi:hypothetical protein
MILIPTITVLIYCGLMVAFFFVEVNAFAIGSKIGDKKTLPFNRFAPDQNARLLNFIVIIGFFWAFLFFI